MKIFGDVYQLLLLMIASGHIVSISVFMSLGGLRKSQIFKFEVLEFFVDLSLRFLEV